MMFVKPTEVTKSFVISYCVRAECSMECNVGCGQKRIKLRNLNVRVLESRQIADAVVRTLKGTLC